MSHQRRDACLVVHIWGDDVDLQTMQERFAQVNEWVQNNAIPAVTPTWVEEITLNHGGGGGP